MSGEKNTIWNQSVAGVIIEDNKVLLARHNHGNGSGMLIVPGGYLEEGETPVEALKREYMEETGLEVDPIDIIGIRFNAHDWYVIFRTKLMGGDIMPDGDERSEVIWLDIDDALKSDEVPDLTKKIITSAMNGTGTSLKRMEYDISNSRHKESIFYGVS